MTFSFRMFPLLILLFAASASLSQTAENKAPAQSTPQYSYEMYFSPYTHHFHPKPTHRHVSVIGLEREAADHALQGAAYFTNSFGQPSVYIYPWGRSYPSVLGVPNLTFKWTGGVIYGYKGEFKDQVENYKGLAPAVIFSLAYPIAKGWNAQLNLAGAAAIQLQISTTLK